MSLWIVAAVGLVLGGLLARGRARRSREYVLASVDAELARLDREIEEDLRLSE